MHATIRTAVIALPIALAMTFGAGAAANAIVPLEDEPPTADVPFFPFFEPEDEDDPPTADVPFFPFEWGEDPDLPEGNPMPQPDPEPEPEPEADTGTDVAPVPEARPYDPTAKPKPIVESGDTEIVAAPEQAAPISSMLLILGIALAGLAAAAGVIALILARRPHEWRS